MFANKKIAMLAALVLVLPACSNKPSDGKIESQVVALLTKGGADKLYYIESFRKTNGLQKDDKTYVASIHYEIVFKKPMEDFMKRVDTQPLDKPAGDLAIAYVVIGKAMAAGVNVKEGGRVPIDEDVTLLKTDNGWLVSNQ